MGSFTDYLETAVANHIFMNAAFTSPATITLALGTVASETGAFTEVPDAANYARVTVAGGNWSTASTRKIDNSATITFNTASGSWGTPDVWGVYDSTTHGGGNLLAYGDITTPTAIANNDTPSFAIGEIEVSFNAHASNVGWGDFWVHDILEHCFKNVALTQPVNLWVGFSQTPLADADGITNEATGGGDGYVRRSTAAGDWDVAGSGVSPGALANAVALTYTVTTNWLASLDVIFITSHATNSTNTELVAFGTINSFTAVVGDTVEINIGDLDVTIV